MASEKKLLSCYLSIIVGLVNWPQLMPENFDVLFFSCTFNVVPCCSPAVSEQLLVMLNVFLRGL